MILSPNVLDEFTHECLAIRVARKLKAIDVIDVLSDLFILRGMPAHIRSDNGPEFVAKAVQEWIAGVGAKTAYIGKAALAPFPYVFPRISPRPSRALAFLLRRDGPRAWRGPPNVLAAGGRIRNRA